MRNRAMLNMKLCMEECKFFDERCQRKDGLDEQDREGASSYATSSLSQLLGLKFQDSLAARTKKGYAVQA